MASLWQVTVAVLHFVTSPYKCFSSVAFTEAHIGDKFWDVTHKKVFIMKVLCIMHIVKK